MAPGSCENFQARSRHETCSRNVFALGKEQTVQSIVDGIFLFSPGKETSVCMRGLEGHQNVNGGRSGPVALAGTHIGISPRVTVSTFQCAKVTYYFHKQTLRVNKKISLLSQFLSCPQKGLRPEGCQPCNKLPPGQTLELRSLTAESRARS